MKNETVHWAVDGALAGRVAVTNQMVAHLPLGRVMEDAVDGTVAASVYWSFMDRLNSPHPGLATYVSAVR